MSIREKLFSNFGWKLVAILLALVLWFHVATEKTYEKIFRARVEVIGLSDDLSVESIMPETTGVSVIGTGKQLLQLVSAGGITAYLDLSAISRPGRYEYDLGLANLYDMDVSSFRNITFVSDNHFVIQIRVKA